MAHNNNSNQNYHAETQHDREPNGIVNDEKIQSYLRELLKERLAISYPNSVRLLENEIHQTKQSYKPFRDNRYIDIYKEKQIRVIVKIQIPVKEYPKFNFVGKLLGPNGNSFRRLQEETMCKMAILGRGSMKDKQREEELRNSLDPKYAHLNEDLHVEVSALGPPSEAHARIAFALAEVRKYLIPDANDTIRQQQLREILSGEAGQEVAERVRHKIAPRIHTQPDPRTPPSVPIPARTNVHTILDRARAAIEESHRLQTNSSFRYEEVPQSQHCYPPNAQSYAPTNGPPPPGPNYPPQQRYISYRQPM